jgi:hypothetical protein
MLEINLMNFEHGYVGCRLFPFTFEGKTLMWYFDLPPGSIANLNDSKTVFIKNIDEDKNTSYFSLRNF